MKTNIDTMQDVIDYIDDHLSDKLDLDSLCRVTGYSKYHLGRIFASVVGLSVHAYIRRRRLTESARLLTFTDKSIMEIALFAGYETQQSFHNAFKTLFKCSPRTFRKKRDFYPLQLKFTVDGNLKLRGDIIMDIKTVNSKNIYLIGYKKNTRFGFFVIGKCWHKIHAQKHIIPKRKNTEFLTGLNDYTNWNTDAERQPAFDYYAASEVSQIDIIPKGMHAKELPAGRYVVFCFKANSKDSLQPVADYIYKEWFPQSTCQLNENARYDFARYGEAVDTDGKSFIEYWVPII